MSLGHDPLSTRPLSDVEATPLAQGGDPAPLPHLGLLLGSGGGTEFSLTPTATVSLAGSISTSGGIGWEIELDAPLNLDLSGSITPAGAIGLGIGIAQTAGASLSGSLSATGALEFAGPFSLTPTQALALTASMSVTGDVQSSILFELIPSAAVSLSGALSVAGDLEILANQFMLTATATVSLAGSLSVTGDVASSDVEDINSGGWPIAAMVSEMRRRKAREAERLKALEEEERKREQALTHAKSVDAKQKALARLEDAKAATERQERLLALLIQEIADAMRQEAEAEEEREILEILAEWM